MPFTRHSPFLLFNKRRNTEDVHEFCFQPIPSLRPHANHAINLSVSDGGALMGTLDNGFQWRTCIFKCGYDVWQFHKKQEKKNKVKLRGEKCTPNLWELFRKRTWKVLHHVVLLYSSQCWRWAVKASLKQNSHRWGQGDKHDKLCTWFKLSLVIKPFIINPHAEDRDSYCSWGFSDWKNETFAALLLSYFLWPPWLKFLLQNDRTAALSSVSKHDSKVLIIAAVSFYSLKQGLL